MVNENYVIEQISVDANPLLPQLPDDNDYVDVIGLPTDDIADDNVYQSYDDVVNTIDSPVIDSMNGNINNITMGNTTIDHTSDENYGTVYLNGNRRSARLNNANVVFNLSIRKAIADYGDLANDAIVNEVNQMIKKGVFEYMHDIPPNIEVLRSHMFLKMKNKLPIGQGSTTFQKATFSLLRKFGLFQKNGTAII